MANEQLKTGDRVRLSPDTRWDTTIIHGRGPQPNPLDCLGTVTRVLSYLIHVDWDNGTYNGYNTYDNDLILVESQPIDPSNITLSNTTW